MSIIYYTLHNGGDGSAYAKFYADKEAFHAGLKLFDQIEEFTGEPEWADDCSGVIDTDNPKTFTTLVDIEEELKSWRDN